MTTKPRAKKFRIRRSPALVKPVPGTPPARSAVPPDDGFGDAPFPGSAAAMRAQQAQVHQIPDAEVSTPEEVSAEEDLQSIRREGLTGRQLRTARRLAQRHGLAVTSDFDAVRQLRARGFDPFERTTLLEIVSNDTGSAGRARANLPQTVEQPQPPGHQVAPSAQAQDIITMQRDIARRRQRRMSMLLLRLAIFVFVPTALAWFYFANIATPLYATKSELVIQQADPAVAGVGGGLLSGTSFATATDSITVQSYLLSREAMLRLDAEHGFRAHFSQPQIDPLQRLDPSSSNEDAYELYQRFVKIGYDPTEGLIRMEVIAADPETSVAFSQALISYAEEQVDSLTQRKREDQMRGAMENFEEAEVKVLDAQNEVLRLQERVGVLDPAAETSLYMSQIANFDTQLREKRLQLQQLLDNPNPNRARVAGVEGDIARLEAVISDLRSQLTESTTESGSLARISGTLRMAEAELQSRQMLLQSALQQVETARIEANRQVRYLSMGVRPVAPDEPTYPRIFENTVLSFLIFAGLYLMASLTASILREQVTS